MADHVAFLRGMNLGGRRITNANLRAHFEAIGLREVDVFRASGNVVFSASDELAATLTAQIEGGLAARLGYPVPTFLRTAAEARAIVADQPLSPPTVAASKGKLQVMLLLEPPAPAAREQALRLAPAGEQLAFGARELYWLPRGGVLESTLDLGALGALVGPLTQRTMGTIDQLTRKYFAA